MGILIFGDNNKCKIIRKGCVGKSPSIEIIYLIDGFKHNFLSINQFCNANKIIVLNHLCKKFKIEILIKHCFVAIGKIIFTFSTLVSLIKPR